MTSEISNTIIGIALVGFSLQCIAIIFVLYRLFVSYKKKEISERDELLMRILKLDKWAKNIICPKTAKGKGTI